MQGENEQNRPQGLSACLALATASQGDGKSKNRPCATLSIPKPSLQTSLQVPVMRCSSFTSLNAFLLKTGSEAN